VQAPLVNGAGRAGRSCGRGNGYNQER
jgi:hypothetical protein